MSKVNLEILSTAKHCRRRQLYQLVQHHLFQFVSVPLLCNCIIVSSDFGQRYVFFYSILDLDFQAPCFLPYPFLPLACPLASRPPFAKGMFSVDGGTIQFLTNHCRVVIFLRTSRSWFLRPAVCTAYLHELPASLVHSSARPQRRLGTCQSKSLA